VKRERMYLAFRLSVAVATALTVHAEASAQQLFWIAPLSGGDQSIAYDISDDGQVVVGTYHDPVNRLLRSETLAAVAQSRVPSRETDRLSLAGRGIPAAHCAPATGKTAT